MPTRTHRTAWGFVALVAWGGVLTDITLSATGRYEQHAPTGHQYGINPDGAAGAFSRLADTLSYFTVWSNIVVAIAMTLLATGAFPRPLWRRAFHLSALLMIIITALVYAVILAPTATVTGWSHLTNPWMHIVTPTLMVLGWLVLGPRGEMSWRAVAGSLVIPVVWVCFMLVRGAVVGAYPYGFADVATLGYPTVLRTIGLILAFALLVAALLTGIDRLLTRRARTPEAPAQVPQ